MTLSQDLNYDIYKENTLTFPEVLQEVVIGVCQSSGSQGPDPVAHIVGQFCKSTSPNSFNSDLVSMIEGIKLSGFQAGDCQAAEDELTATWDTIVKFIATKWTGNVSSLTADSSWDCNTTLGVIALHIFFIVR